jgi:hypothetical protein
LGYLRHVLVHLSDLLIIDAPKQGGFLPEPPLCLTARSLQTPVLHEQSLPWHGLCSASNTIFTIRNTKGT